MVGVGVVVSPSMAGVELSARRVEELTSTYSKYGGGFYCLKEIKTDAQKHCKKPQKTRRTPERKINKKRQANKINTVQRQKIQVG